MKHAAAALLCMLSALACATSLDLERARQVLERPGPEPAPTLSDEPNPKLDRVEGLRASSGELLLIALRWDPSHEKEIAGYLVDRSPSADGPFVFIATVTDRFRTVYVDRGLDLAPKRQVGRAGGGLGHGESYYYRVRPYDGAGRVASATPEVVSGTTAAKPTPPTGLQAYSHLPRRVALRWLPAADPNVVGYVVYRSPSASGEFTKLGRLEGRHQTVFLDDRLPDLAVFYYRVASVDSSEAIGDPGGAERAVTKAEPLPPTGLRVSDQSVGTNQLVWQANVEPDLAGYRLYRRRAGADAQELVTEVEASATRAVDAAVSPGERVSYRLFAFDADGLRSAVSDALEVVGLDYGLRVAPLPDGARLSWDAAAQRGFAETKVLRVGLGGAKEIGRSRDPEFVYRGAEPGARLRLQLIGVRTDGTDAPASAIVEASVP